MSLGTHHRSVGATLPKGHPAVLLIPVRLLDGFMTVRAAQTISSRLSRMTLLDEIRSDLDSLERSLPPQLQHGFFPTDVPCPTGIRECCKQRRGSSE